MKKNNNQIKTSQNTDKPVHIHAVNPVKTAVLFRGEKGDPSTLSEVVGQGVGAVSACWSNLSGAGVFESERAVGIVEEMLTWIHEHYEGMSTYKDDLFSDGARLVKKADFEKEYLNDGFFDE